MSLALSAAFLGNALRTTRRGGGRRFVDVCACVGCGENCSGRVANGAPQPYTASTHAGSACWLLLRPSPHSVCCAAPCEVSCRLVWRCWQRRGLATSRCMPWPRRVREGQPAPHVARCVWLMRVWIPGPDWRVLCRRLFLSPSPVARCSLGTNSLGRPEASQAKRAASGGAWHAATSLTRVTMCVHRLPLPQMRWRRCCMPLVRSGCGDAQITHAPGAPALSWRAAGQPTAWWHGMAGTQPHGPQRGALAMPSAAQPSSNLGRRAAGAAAQSRSTCGAACTVLGAPRASSLLFCRRSEPLERAAAMGKKGKGEFLSSPPPPAQANPAPAHATPLTLCLQERDRSVSAATRRTRCAGGAAGARTTSRRAPARPAATPLHASVPVSVQGVQGRPPGPYETCRSRWLRTGSGRAGAH